MSLDNLQQGVKISMPKYFDSPQSPPSHPSSFLVKKPKKENKKPKRKVGKYIFLSIVALLLLWGFKSCSDSLMEIKIEKAGELIDKCENKYALWQVNEKDCDDARKLYFHYTDDEWKVEKKRLIDLGKITEEDYLYDVIKQEEKQ